MGEALQQGVLSQMQHEEASLSLIWVGLCTQYERKCAFINGMRAIIGATSAGSRRIISF